MSILYIIVLGGSGGLLWSGSNRETDWVIRWMHRIFAIALIFLGGLVSTLINKGQ